MNCKEFFNDKSNNIFKINKVESQNSFGYSSDEEISDKGIKNEKIINKIDTDWISFMYKEYKIENFNFNIINNNSISKLNQNNKNKDHNKNNINNESKKRGRKRKRDDSSDKDKDNDDSHSKTTHDKFSDDNIRKKCKNMISKYALEYINKMIKVKFNNNIGHGKFKKELKILNQQDKIKSTVNIDKTFLDKSLKDIFSENISSRFNKYPPTHNKDIIESLINEIDDEKRIYFIKLFNLTFFDCLNYFVDDIAFRDDLNGFKKFSSIKGTIEQKQGKEYVNLLWHYFKNFKEIINNKKPRKINKIKSTINK